MRAGRGRIVLGVLLLVGSGASRARPWAGAAVEFRRFWARLNQVTVNPDTNGDFLISPEEARVAARQTVKNMEAFFREVLARFDTDGDGVIEPEEAMRIRNLLAENGRKRPRILDVVDSDGDWNLSDKEADAAERRLLADYQRRNRMVLRRWDRNGDGRLEGAEREAAQHFFEAKKRSGFGGKRLRRLRGGESRRHPWGKWRRGGG